VTKAHHFETYNKEKSSINSISDKKRVEVKQLNEKQQLEKNL